MIWTRVFAAAAGWTVAGIEGFVIGLLFGALGDRLAAGRLGPGVPLRWLSGRRRDELLPFLIALAAKLARAGGAVDEHQRHMIALQLQLSTSEMTRHRTLLDQAAQTPARYHRHVAQILQRSGGDKVLLARVGQALRAVTHVSGAATGEQDDMLRDIERQLGLEPRPVQGSCRQAEEARRLLGVGANASAAQIRQAWRQAIRECHPDRRPADAMRATRHAGALNVARDRLLNGPTPKEMNGR